MLQCVLVAVRVAERVAECVAASHMHSITHPSRDQGLPTKSRANARRRANDTHDSSVIKPTKECVFTHPMPHNNATESSPGRRLFETPVRVLHSRPASSECERVFAERCNQLSALLRHRNAHTALLLPSLRNTLLRAEELQQSVRPAAGREQDWCVLCFCLHVCVRVVYVHTCVYPCCVCVYMCVCVLCMCTHMCKRAVYVHTCVHAYKLTHTLVSSCPSWGTQESE